MARINEASVVAGLFQSYCCCCLFCSELYDFYANFFKVEKQTMKLRSNNQASSVVFINEPIQKESQEQASKKQEHTSVQSQSLEKQKHHVVENQQPCPKKQKTKTRFCLPGSLSKYHNMRKKEVRNSRGDVVFEGHSENENEYELDKELELGSLSLERIIDDEQETGDNTDIVAHEKESSPLIEPPKEGMLLYCLDSNDFTCVCEW